ncbi:ribonuclease H-like domain-containing protein [Natrarchaeobaculum aegyptiacum]|uniref:YprB ribonuclease H-like domain-containing protein n=1 Tax=Natrarchaeobaculum aegyptiacum TaxID=745377 RepID=A0A2Z2HZL1_9EURY|nr:ribonuclease H-like domain-containing protein [Natrarchaeobaculum aegyptiacum]ARS91447.1 hypothetical protein B1756_18125 [Natrarchaeobaculum aegyptiacum]
MIARAGVRLLALPPSAVADRPAATLEDVAATLEPEAVWVPGPARRPQTFARARRAFDVPVVHPPLEAGGDPVDEWSIDDDGGVAVGVVPRLEGVDASVVDDQWASVSDDPITLLCDQVETIVRPTELTTSLTHARDLAETLPTDRGTTLLTASEPAGYDERWHLESESGEIRTVDHDPATAPPRHVDDCVSVRVVGAGPVEAYDDRTSFALVELTDDGVERVDTHAVTNFGLESVSGVGPKTAGRLSDEGVETRSDLLETPIDSLTTLPGIGRERAETMHAHARVLESGEPRRVTDDPLPGENWSRPPLCLDVETDGLSPTIIWQIGVYDPKSDDHHAFVERDDPTDTVRVLESFCDWLLDVHPDRALVTWNGWQFDYRYLGSFIARHVSYYHDEWESIPKYDLYDWAVREDNAILPGRTNQLEDVATALGYEDAGTGLDGAETAAAYQRFARTGEELEWDRHEAYCEDDCRALWHVYERLADTPRRSIRGSRGGRAGASDRSPGDDGTPTESAGRPTTEQTGLGDF